MTSPVVVGIGLLGGTAFVLGAAAGDIPIPSSSTAHMLYEAIVGGVLVYITKQQKKLGEEKPTPRQDSPSNPATQTFPPQSHDSARLTELVDDVKIVMKDLQEHRGDFREHRAETRQRLRTVEGRLGINNPQTGELERPGDRS